jgi:hypothetical protein
MKAIIILSNGFIVCRTQPAELMLAFQAYKSQPTNLTNKETRLLTSHMIAPIILLDARLAVWTWRGGFSDLDFGSFVESCEFFHAFAVVCAELFFMPRDVVDCAGFVGAGFAGEDWVGDAA